MKSIASFKLLVIAGIALAAFPMLLAAEPQGPPQAQAAQARPFSGNITAGTQLESGSTSLRGVDIKFNLSAPYGPGGDIVVATEYRYGRTTIDTDSGSIVRTIANRFYAHGGVDHYFARHFLLMARTSFLQDEVQHIDHRVEQMTGVGVHASHENIVHFRFVPGVSVLTEDKQLVGEMGVDYGAGFFQDLQIHITPVWTFAQRFFLRRDFQLATDYYFDGSATLTGAIAGPLGVQLAYQYTHENLVRPDDVKRYQNITAGLQFKF